MAFEKFKANHAGLGPLKLVGETLLTRQLGLPVAGRNARALLDKQADAILADDQASEDLKGLAQSAKQTKMQLPQLAAAFTQLRQGAADERTLNAGVAGMSDLLDSHEASAITAADKAQVADLKGRLKLAHTFAMSSNPKLRDAGIAELAKITGDTQAFSTTNEAQEITDRTTRETEGIAGEKLRFDRDMGLSDDLRKNVVTPFQTQSLAFEKAKQLLDTGDRIGYDFAFTMAIQALDGSVVREGERLAYTGSSGLSAQMVDTYNRWLGEKTPEQETTLRRAIAATHNAVVDTYRKSVDGYRRQTDAYGGDWNRVGSVVPELQDWEAPGNVTAVPKDTPANIPLAAAAAGKTLLDATPDTVKTAAATVAGFNAATILRTLAQRFPQVAAGTLYTYMATHVPPQGEGEGDEDYQHRLNAMMAGEDILAPAALGLPKRSTDEYPQ